MHRRILPGTYEKALVVLDRQFGSGMYEYHMCGADKCGVVYRAEYADDTDCPSCGAPRYDQQGRPKKRLYYMSVIDWLEYIFSKVCRPFGGKGIHA
jgi:hypothetical protein